MKILRELAGIVSAAARLAFERARAQRCGDEKRANDPRGCVLSLRSDDPNGVPSDRQANADQDLLVAGLGDRAVHCEGWRGHHGDHRCTVAFATPGEARSVTFEITWPSARRAAELRALGQNAASLFVMEQQPRLDPVVVKMTRPDRRKP
jgi:hypothetical protein